MSDNSFVISDVILTFGSWAINAHTSTHSKTTINFLFFMINLSFGCISPFSFFCLGRFSALTTHGSKLSLLRTAAACPYHRKPNQRSVLPVGRYPTKDV